MKEQLFYLCRADGVSGAENNISSLVADVMGKYAQVTITPNNNVIAVMGNQNSDKHILFDAHIDQIGLIVTYIDEKGFIKASACGGIDRRVLLGSVVKILGKETITGVICCMPPHLSDGDEDKAVSADNIWIDTGMNFDKVNEIVSLGDRIVFYTEPKALLNNKFTSAALDNRAGVAALIKAAEILSKRKLESKVTFLFSSQEETNESGAKTGAFYTTPDEAVIVDVSFGSQPSVPKEKSGDLGGGVMICTAPVLSKAVVNKLISISQLSDKKYQMEVSGGSTGTNADAISVSKSGVKCGVVSIPLKNMHTQAEVIDVRDVNDTAELLALYAIGGGAD